MKFSYGDTHNGALALEGWTNFGSRRASERLVAVVREVAQDALDGAAQNAAQVIDGLCGDIFIMFEAVERAMGEVVPAGEGVPVFRRIFQGFPKRCVINHA